eukprot:scaffold214_cov160-Ochromonas_danica.AAC.8
MLDGCNEQFLNRKIIAKRGVDNNPVSQKFGMLAVMKLHWRGWGLAALLITSFITRRRFPLAHPLD